MREYELIYIVQPDATPEREKEIQSRVDDAISRGGGTTLLWDDWGRRKLAYEIQKFQKGHYLLVSFLGDGRFIPEIERALRIDPDVLRFLTVKLKEDVGDIEGRIARAREEEAERVRKREERERQEAARAERQEARAEAEAEPSASAGAEEPASEREIDTPDAGA